MDIDLVALRQLERDKELKLDVLLRALEDALLNAYAKTPGAVDGSRVTIDTKTGRVRVMAPEKDEEGNQVSEFDDTPADFDGCRHRPPGDLPAPTRGGGRTEVRTLRRH